MTPKPPLHIAHLSSVHSALDHRIFYKECRSLAAAGFRVSLIAPHACDEFCEGVQILHVPPSRSRWQRLVITVPRVFLRAMKLGADVYHLHDPELLPVGLLLRLAGRRVVYDAHEDLPAQVLGKRWIPAALRPLVAIFARGLVRVCPWFTEQVVAATPGIAGQFGPRGLAVCNFPELDCEEPNGEPDRFAQNIVFVGTLTRSRGLEQIVEAMQFVEPASARLVFAGRETEAGLLARLAELRGWNRVEYRGVLPPPQVPRLLAEGSVGLVAMHPEPNHSLHPYPVKLLEYLRAGLPVVASDFPVWREFLEPIRCARFVDPLDPRAIAREISWLLAHPNEAAKMGARGRRAVLEQFNWNREAERLVAMYRRLAA